MIRRLFTVLAIATLWAAPLPAADFDHAAHLGYLPDATCDTCHVAGAKAIVPDTKVCLNCHDQAFVGQLRLPGLKTHGPLWGLQHRPFAKGNTYDCYACHEQYDCLECHKSGFADEQGAFGNGLANIHRSDFHVTHPIAARTDPQLCSSCHENKFCVECHENFAAGDLAILSHRRGWSNIPTSPTGAAHAEFVAALKTNPEICLGCHADSVIFNGTWSGSHAREARKNLATCQSCHPGGDVCLRCHSARSGLKINPHPSDWDDIKGRLKRASNGSTCRKCH